MLPVSSLFLRRKQAIWRVQTAGENEAKLNVEAAEGPNREQ